MNKEEFFKAIRTISNSINMQTISHPNVPGFWVEGRGDNYAEQYLYAYITPKGRKQAKYIYGVIGVTKRLFLQMCDGHRRHYEIELNACREEMFQILEDLFPKGLEGLKDLHDVITVINLGLYEKGGKTYTKELED